MSESVELAAPGFGHGKWYISAAAEKVAQALTGRGVLNAVYATNSNASDRWIWVFDNTASSGTMLCGPFLAPAGKYVSVELQYGKECVTGIRVAASSTQNTFTDAGGTDCLFNVGYNPLERRVDQT